MRAKGIRHYTVIGMPQAGTIVIDWDAPINKGRRTYVFDMAEEKRMISSLREVE